MEQHWQCRLYCKKVVRRTFEERFSPGWVPPFSNGYWPSSSPTTEPDPNDFFYLARTLSDKDIPYWTDPYSAAYPYLAHFYLITRKKYTNLTFLWFICILLIKFLFWPEVNSLLRYIYKLIFYDFYEIIQ